MIKLATADIVILLVQLGSILALAKLFGELFRRYRQPAVIGEILAGVILGPTILGVASPELFHWLFQSSQGAAFAIDGLVTLSSLFLLFVVGLEIDIHTIKREKRAVFWLGSLGIIIPFLIGCSVGWLMYPITGLSVARNIFSLFLGAALSISALPVIARILIDLDLIKSKIGSIIIAVATINDIVGWIIFTIVLGMASTTGHNNSIAITITATFLLVLLSVTVFRSFMDWLLREAGRRLSVTGVSMGIIVPAIFFLAIITEKIGIHAVFGAFLLGVAIAESKHFCVEARHSIEKFTTHILAPLFFASVGLKANFLLGFDLPIILIILVAAYVSKLLASHIGGRLSGLDKQESLAVGLGIAARGGMGIILASISYDVGLINAKIFEALVIMALVTSMSSGAIKTVLSRSKSK